ncbi:MAG: hypothetical protein R3C01_14930 [Planctomycetaceae bacterium]
MTVRDEYAGTLRRCPKCKQKFEIPTVGLPDDEESDATNEVDPATTPSPKPTAKPKETVTEADPFDPVAFLSGDPPAKGDSKPSKSPSGKSDAASSLKGNEQTAKKSTAAASEEGEGFDPMDVLLGGPTAGAGGASTKQPASPSKGKAPKDDTPAENFSQGNISIRKGSRGDIPTIPETPKAPEFDPLDVLGDGPPPPDKPLAPSVEQAPPVEKATATESPAEVTPPAGTETPEATVSESSTEKPSTDPVPAKELPERYRKIEEPVAEILPEGAELPKYRRPVKKSAPIPEDENFDDFDNAGRPQPKPQPKRPSWAKPSADEPAPGAAPTVGGGTSPSASVPTGSSTGDGTGTGSTKRPTTPGFAPDPKTAGTGSYERVDVSPAAAAAAAAVSGAATGTKPGPPVEEEPDEPLVDVAAIAGAIKRKRVAIIGGLVSAVLLFLMSTWFVQSGFYSSPPRWPELFPVTGKVTQAGKPLAGARVLFYSTSQHARTLEGVTDSNGQYSLQLIEGMPGAPEGRYRVKVEHISENHDTINSRFGSRSGLTRIVSSKNLKDGEIVIDLDVTPPK